MKLRASFEIVEMKDGHIHLIDECEICNTMSITNDAEAVCEYVFKKHGNKRITYMDTDGRIDELVHDRGVFKDYKFGHEGLVID